MPLRLALVLLLVAMRPAAALTIVALGDSITAGVTRAGGMRPGERAQRDPRGGYPGRLERLLGADVRVVNRGFGGSTTRDWLGGLGAAPAVRREALEHIWSDFRPLRDPAPDASVLDYVLASDRPDVVLILVGTNDLTQPDSPAEVAERIGAIARVARAAAPAVLVGTLLPSRRSSPAAVEQVNARLCAIEPDCVRLDRAFAAKGGLALLGDHVHPDARGQAVLAYAFGKALRARHLVPRGTHRHDSSGPSARASRWAISLVPAAFG